MTDLAHALAAKMLTPFEGVDVISAGIEMPGAGGGLREALDFEPVEFAHAEEGYLVVHWKVKKVRFDPIKDTDALRRVHVLEVLETTLTDEASVNHLLAGQRDKIRQYREIAAGIQRLPMDDIDDDGALADLEAAALAEEAEDDRRATEADQVDGDGYYDPAIVAEGATTHEIGSAPKRARTPRKPKEA